MGMKRLELAHSTILSAALTIRSCLGPSSAPMQLHSGIYATVWRRAAGTACQIVDLVPTNKPT
jgi:hypothetical protein